MQLIRGYRNVLRVGAAVLLAAACNPDLNITNPNNPDVARAIATPGDVRQLIGSSYNSWYVGMQSACCNNGNAEPDPGIMTAIMADNMTATFGNFAMRFNNQEPRVAYNNSSAAQDGKAASMPYDNLYGALGAANDGLNAIKRGVKVAINKSAPDETPEMKALAILVQGLTLGFESLVFDKGFVVDEDTPAGTAALAPYTEVSAAAVAKFEKGIAEATGKDWTIPAEFTPGLDLSAANYIRMANTMAARQLAYTPRTPEENTQVNWTRVLGFAEKGISTGGAPFDLQAEGDGGTLWYDLVKGYGELESWVRADQRVVQLADPTQPRVWTSQVAPVRAQPADARFAKGAPDAAGNVKTPGADFWFYRGTGSWDIARGPYLFSSWGHARYIEYGFEVDDPFFGNAPFVLKAENDLLIAEALIRTNGDRARAATLINKTRVGRGQLPPVSGGSSTNDLLAAIFYERDIELFGTGAGQPWFDRRRIDKGLTYNGIDIGAGLQPGTPRHLPVPAKELETLGIPVYTYGGSSPNPVFPEK
jgi:starch-binding outer membrane protein, SusD/RagB family